MITIESVFLKQLVNPALLVDADGHVLVINEAASHILATAGISNLGTICRIDPLFEKLASSDVKRESRSITLGNASRQVTTFPVRLQKGRNGYLYLFDTADILKHLDFDAFLDHIDLGIGIINQDGVLEHLNQTLSKYIGFDIKQFVGRNVQELIEERFLTESASLNALKAKIPTNTKVTYGSGVTVDWRSIPFLDNQGKIRKVISTGRDVTRIINLESELSSSESLKDQYHKRLNILEVLLDKDRIIYSSEKMKQVIQIAVKAGKFDSPVFLWGESGVGKEMIAKLVHHVGDRAAGPFVAINCSAIPSELLESEFFGYQEGAFTGAKKGGRKGLFDEAEGGTIFLDEISELPLAMQSKLLRVIQEQEYLRVGSNRPVSTDVRIIASTNLSQEQLSDGTGFRRDLFYRLSVIPINIPPLRDRRDDIFPLIHFFLKMLNLKYGSNVRIANSLFPRLYHYNWPGNVRELKNVIERLLVVANSDEVGDAEYELVNQLDIVSEKDSGSDISVNGIMPLKDALGKVEEILITRAYQETGSIEKTAKLLHITPSTIYRKINKGQIRLGRFKNIERWHT